MPSCDQFSAERHRRLHHGRCRLLSPPSSPSTQHPSSSPRTPSSTPVSLHHSWVNSDISLLRRSELPARIPFQEIALSTSSMYLELDFSGGALQIPKPYSKVCSSFWTSLSRLNLRCAVKIVLPERIIVNSKHGEQCCVALLVLPHLPRAFLTPSLLQSYVTWSVCASCPLFSSIIRYDILCVIL